MAREVNATVPRYARASDVRAVFPFAFRGRAFLHWRVALSPAIVSHLLILRVRG